MEKLSEVQGIGNGFLDLYLRSTFGPIALRNKIGDQADIHSPVVCDQGQRFHKVKSACSNRDLIS